MTKHFIAAVFMTTSLSAVNLAWAEAPDVSREKAAEKIEERMKATAERLNLSDEQKPQVKAVMRESAKERREILANFGFGEGSRPDLKPKQRKEMRQQLKTASQATAEKLSAILSPEQMAEYKKIQEEQRMNKREKVSSR